jgi:hypothetical protein
MSKVRMAIAAVALTAATLAVTPAPAQAAPILRGVFYYDWDCHRVGQYGMANYGWPGPYTCQYMNFGPNSVFWFLYA